MTEYIEKRYYETCPRCNGSQRVFSLTGHVSECGRCDGPGYIIVTRKISLDEINAEFDMAADRD